MKDGRTDKDEEEENQKPEVAQQAHIPHKPTTTLSQAQLNALNRIGNQWEETEAADGRTTDGRGTPGEGHKVKTAPEGIGGREGKKSLGGGNGAKQ